MGGGCSRCCSGFVTCCYGCRRSRSYTQKMSPKTAERIWFSVLSFTFLVTLADMLLWISASNDSDRVNHGFYDSIGKWFPFYFTFQVVSYIAFAYVTLLMIFGFLHVLVRERLQLHLLHKIGVCLTLSVSLALIIFVSIETRFLWHFIPSLLQYIGPFLHLSAVTVMTIMSWFVAGELSTLKKKGIPLQQAWFWYFLVLIGLYITPIFIVSPCIMSSNHDNNPPKPLLFAHKGAEEISPENTNISFTIALDDYDAHGLESDVRISEDGIPYVFHDDTLLRTTNAKAVFPDRFKDHPDTFTIDELQSLDVGSWFAKTSPFLNAWQLSSETKAEFVGQRILTMVNMFDLALERNKSLLFDVRPPPSDHPYAGDWLNRTLDVITGEIGLEEDEFDYWQAPNGPHYVFFIKLFDDRTMQNVYNDIPFQDVRTDLENNITTNVWTVNEDWFFQYYWCAGAVSVTTSSIHTLSGRDKLVWQLTPTHYLIMWVLFDVASFIWVVVVFIIQITLRKRHTRRLRRHVSDGSKYNYQFTPMSDRPGDMYAS